jgi:hypothetical protein
MFALRIVVEDAARLIVFLLIIVFVVHRYISGYGCLIDLLTTAVAAIRSARSCAVVHRAALCGNRALILLVHRDKSPRTRLSSLEGVASV